MNKKELVVIAVAVAALGIAASLAYANAVTPYLAAGYRQNQGYGPGGMMWGGGGMMGGHNNQQYYPQATPNNNQPPQQYYGHGMMGGGMMGGGYGGMMGGMMGYYSQVPTALTHERAVQIANNYLASVNNPNLGIGEFEEYSYNFYVSIVEKSTGKSVAEILIDRFTGYVYPEPQSMMWNTKYGGMGGGGMMGGWYGGWYGGQQRSGAAVTVTPEDATKIAQSFLNVTYPGTTVDEITAFDGYYTIMTTIGGGHYGMLSINGYTGEIWYHTWHGKFISEVETT
ncbi:MAG: hypothetical protein M1503_02505 [Thaumarchaeota archaeon]|nr:hypothetical protein [Nitrososphaerota archaeon]MCL5317122.1 hypothetical protein [Nitrososphaerota archaeon]